MVTNVATELAEAERQVRLAHTNLGKLQSIQESYIAQLKARMVVGDNIPIKVARLSDNQYAVHVFYGGSQSSRLHIVDLTEIET